MLITPTYFSISPPSQEGQVYGTEFTFASLLPLEYTSFIWDFGDGYKIYNDSEVSHTFQYPGIYTITLSAWTDYGKFFSERGTINVDYVIRDRIVFTKTPDTFNFPGIINSEPFTVSVTSSKIDQPLGIYLQSYYSKSVPHYAVPTKWKFLVPTWKFLDINRNILTDNFITIPTEPIYNEDSKIIAVKGEVSFYYVDDLATGADLAKECPLILGVTLSTQHFSYPLESVIYPYASYSNNETVRALQSWQIAENLPTNLKVTENYINDVYPLKWANTPIPLTITCLSDPSKLQNAILEGDVQLSTNLAYPQTNELGAFAPVIVSLSSDGLLPGEKLVQGIHYSTPSDKYFKVTDENGTNVAGYVLTEITPHTNALTAVREGSSFVVAVSTIAANTLEEVAKFGLPYGYRIRANTYVAHPHGNNINKVAVTKFPKECEIVNYFEDLGILAQGSTFSYIDTPALTSIDIKQETLSGCSAVYGMAFNPIKGLLYACDADTGTISMYDSSNVLLSSLQLSSLVGTEKIAPSHVSIDRLYNVWVSLFDNYKLLKFDYNLKYLLSAAPSISALSPQDQMSLDFPYFPDRFIKKTNVFLSPPIVETDRNNHVWACWSNVLGESDDKVILSKLCHFDSRGREIRQDSIFLPKNCDPVDLAVDPSNSIWIVCRGSDSIKYYDRYLTNTITKNVTGFWKPSYIALDRDANIWVTHGYDLCSKYDTATEKISTWQFTAFLNLSTNSYELSSKYIHTITPEMTSKAYKENEIWGGLSIDVYDRIWLIDSVKNVFCSFRGSNPSDIISIPVVPNVTEMPVILENTSFVSKVSSNSVRSAQAAGDWTGNKWYQKYAGVLSRYPIFGTSTPFKLYDINKSYQISKVNETFDAAGYFQSLAFPEVLNNNQALFNEFFSAVVGDPDPTKESMGRVTYERIANFINNHADLDTVEIEQLKSFAEQVNIGVKTYGSSFPAAINRLISLFSVHKNNLRGIPKLATDITDGIGEFVTNGQTISADTYYYIKDKDYGDSYIVQAVSTIDGAKTFPLEDFDIAGLRTPLWENYYVFMYNDKLSYKGYTGNLIDWDSPFTSVSYNLSSYEDWYGDVGLVESMFNNLLTKQLIVE